MDSSFEEATDGLQQNIVHWFLNLSGQIVVCQDKLLSEHAQTENLQNGSSRQFVKTDYNLFWQITNQPWQILICSDRLLIWQDNIWNGQDRLKNKMCVSDPSCHM